MTPLQRAALWPMLQELAQAHPEHFATQMVPYLADFPHHWQHSLATLTSLTQLEEALDVLPCARFDLDLTGMDGTIAIEEWVQSPLLQSVHALNLKDHDLGEEGARALAGSRFLCPSIRTTFQR